MLGTGHGVSKTRSVVMYFHGLSTDELLSKKRSESYEESSEQNQIIMVTLFGQQVYTAKGSQDTSRIESSDTNWFGRSGEKVIMSGGLGLLDLNQTPVNEPVSNHHQCFFQDLNFPHIQETETSSEKSGLDYLTPTCLDNVHGKDSTASPASCCTTENNSRTEGEDLSEVIRISAESLLHISLNQSHDFPFKHWSRPNSSSQELLDKLEVANEEGPACSYDSYELHTLGIIETSPEDVCCVSSKAEDELSNKKEVGVKVRRGRRMKNFRKEILPELVSLSRNDIREDINILETVLRSREYKKMQGKTRDGKCKEHTRNNKGSSQRYVGRRRR